MYHRKQDDGNIGFIVRMCFGKIALNMKYVHAYADLLTFHLLIIFHIANLHLKCNNLGKEYYACPIF